MCDDWLAIDKSDGKIEKVIPVASTNQIATFKKVFDTFAKKDFSDGHLWFSRKLFFFFFFFFISVMFYGKQ